MTWVDDVIAPLQKNLGQAKRIFVREVPDMGTPRSHDTMRPTPPL